MYVNWFSNWLPGRIGWQAVDKNQNEKALIHTDFYQYARYMYFKGKHVMLALRKWTVIHVSVIKYPHSAEKSIAWPRPYWKIISGLLQMPTELSCIRYYQMENLISVMEIAHETISSVIHVLVFLWYIWSGWVWRRCHVSYAICLQLGNVCYPRGEMFYFFCFFSFIPFPLFFLSLSFIISNISFLPVSGRRNKMTHKGNWQTMQIQIRHYRMWHLIRASIVKPCLSNI